MGEFPMEETIVTTEAGTSAQSDEREGSVQVLKVIKHPHPSLRQESGGEVLGCPESLQDCR